MPSEPDLREVIAKAWIAAYPDGWFTEAGEEAARAEVDWIISEALSPASRPALIAALLEAKVIEHLKSSIGWEAALMADGRIAFTEGLFSGDVPLYRLGES